MTTVANIKDQLLAQLDDSSQTFFTDAKLLLLLNEAVKFILNEQSQFGQYFRTKQAEISITSGTSEYILTNATAAVFTNDPFRKAILIERTDSDRRQQGTIIRFDQRNNWNKRWFQPVVYFRYEDGDWYLVFAYKDDPQEAMTLTLTYAPTPVALTGDASEFEDVPDDYINFLLLRATFMGLGGEKNADKFWATQYSEALAQARREWSNEPGFDEVLEVDN